MKYPIFCIRDVKVGFMPPYADQSEQSAIRGFAYSVNGEGVMNFAPKDYSLYKIGEFDTETGRIESELPVLVAEGVNVYGDNK